MFLAEFNFWIVFNSNKETDYPVYLYRQVEASCKDDAQKAAEAWFHGQGCGGYNVGLIEYLSINIVDTIKA